MVDSPHRLSAVASAASDRDRPVGSRPEGFTCPVTISGQLPHPPGPDTSLGDGKLTEPRQGMVTVLPGLKHHNGS